MTGEPKVLLTTLWQRTSASGRQYLSGFLGKGRIIGFPGEALPDGTPTWNLYLQAGDRDDTRKAVQRQAAATTQQPKRVWPARQPDKGDPRPFDDELPDDLA